MAAEPIGKMRLADGRVRYRVVVDTGYDSGGRRLQRTSTHDTLRDARNWLAKVRTEIADGSYQAPVQVTVDEHLDRWLAGKRDIRPSTRESYIHSLRPVRRALGGKRLDALTKADVDSLVNELLTNGNRGRPLSPRSVTMTLVVFQQAMKDAMRQDLVRRNVVELVERPRQVHTEMKSWTTGEARAFLRHVEGHRLHAAFLLTLHGLRRGEVLGLRWQDVDLDADDPTLRVVSTRVQVTATQEATGEPKTARGRRTLPIPAPLATALRQALDQQRQEERQAGTAYEASGLVVVDELGKPMRLERYGDAFRRQAREAGLPDIRLHDARHTAASLMLGLGYPVHVVAAWLGHDPVMTQRVYAHVHRAELQSLGDAYGRALSPEL